MNSLLRCYMSFNRNKNKRRLLDLLFFNGFLFKNRKKEKIVHKRIEETVYFYRDTNPIQYD